MTGEGDNKRTTAGASCMLISSSDWEAIQAELRSQTERLQTLERFARAAISQRRALEQRLADLEKMVGVVPAVPDFDGPEVDVEAGFEADLEWKPGAPTPESVAPRIDLSTLLPKHEDEQNADSASSHSGSDSERNGVATGTGKRRSGTDMQNSLAGTAAQGENGDGFDIDDKWCISVESEAEEWRPQVVAAYVEREEIPLDVGWQPISVVAGTGDQKDAPDGVGNAVPTSGNDGALGVTQAVDQNSTPGDFCVGTCSDTLAGETSSEGATESQPEVSVRPGLLFKGRYTDVVWPQEADAEELTALGSCEALVGDDARTDLDRIMRRFPLSWRIRRRLFDLEFAAGNYFYAYVAGWPLLYAPLPHSDKQRFRQQMTEALNALFDERASASENRWKCLRLAELVMDVDPDESLNRVNEGLRQGSAAIEEESRLHYYRLCLADWSRESFDDCVVALQNIDGRFHLFDDLHLTVERYCPGQMVMVSLIDALLHQGREASRALEERCHLGGADFNPNLVVTEHDERADLLIELIFNQIYQRIAMPDVVSRTAEEKAILEQSEILPPVQFSPIGMLNRLNRKMFGVECQVRVYSGDEHFSAIIIPGEVPTIVLHRDFSLLRPVEQQALLARRLFQIHHRHHIVRRIHDVMTNQDRLVMMHSLCQIARESGSDPGAENMALLDSLKPSESSFLDKLERLSNSIALHTGSFEFAAGRELMFAKRPFNKLLDGASDRFVARLVGMTEASYSIALSTLGAGDLYNQLVETGFRALYDPSNGREFLLRLRLQRLWVAPLQEELWY